MTHNDGVMRELAEQGGCHMADMANPVAMMRVLEEILSDRSLLERLPQEAVSRKIRTWQDYAAEMAERLVAV